MTNDPTSWLVREVSDLLDAGPVGLYEFIWLLRGADQGLPADQLRSHAADALEHLQLVGAGHLVWLTWPSENAVAVPAPTQPGPDDWADPVKEKPYLALAPI